MKHVFQKRLLRSVVGIALIVSSVAAAQAQGIPGGQVNAPSFAGQGRQGRVQQAPRAVENVTQSRLDRDVRTPRQRGADRRGSGDWNRGGQRSGQTEYARPQPERVSVRQDGEREGYRKGGRDHGDRGGTGGYNWAPGGYRQDRFDGDRGRWGYPAYGKHPGRYGAPVYRGWGWANGGYAAPIIVAPIARRGWAYNHAFAVPVIVVSPYRGWAIRPGHSVKRRN